MSASLLFARPPAIKTTLDGPQGAANQAWLDALIDDAFHMRLLEAAEMCAALGGVFLRVVWDLSVSDKPWIQPVPADVAVPAFSYDKLQSVTFWRVLQDNGADVVRHLEMHVPGQNAIIHGVYQGDQSDLGEIVPLSDFPVTARLAGDLQGDTLYFPDQPLDASSVVYIPNMRPNKIWRDLGPHTWPLGRSDFCGVEALMDNVDEVYSSWVRDVRLAKSRLIVPPEYLDNIGRGQGAVFEPERQVFSPLNFLHGDNGPSITANQFAIRWQEHQQTVQDLLNRIVQEAGYSPQTFGDYQGNAPTATEIEARERTSMLTRGKKIGYWRPALADIIYGLMTISVQQFGNTAITPERPDIEFTAVATTDEGTLASTAAMMAQADAISKQTLVQYLHPDWDSEQVNDEVTRIFQETGLVLAGRARVALTPPMGASLSEDIAALGENAPVPELPPDLPGSPGDYQTDDGQDTSTPSGIPSSTGGGS